MGARSDLEFADSAKQNRPIYDQYEFGKGWSPQRMSMCVAIQKKPQHVLVNHVCIRWVFVAPMCMYVCLCACYLLLLGCTVYAFSEFKGYLCLIGCWLTWAGFVTFHVASCKRLFLSRACFVSIACLCSQCVLLRVYYFHDQGLGLCSCQLAGGRVIRVGLVPRWLFMCICVCVFARKCRFGKRVWLCLSVRFFGFRIHLCWF